MSENELVMTPESFQSQVPYISLSVASKAPSDPSNGTHTDGMWCCCLWTNKRSKFGDNPTREMMTILVRTPFLMSSSDLVTNETGCLLTVNTV